MTSVTSSSSLTYLRRDDPAVNRRSKSVSNSNNSGSTYGNGPRRKIDKNDPTTFFSKKTPLAALSTEEYRQVTGVMKWGLGCSCRCCCLEMIPPSLNYQLYGFVVLWFVRTYQD